MQGIPYICLQKETLIMEEELDYNCVPNTYTHCFNTDCPRAGECLRQMVARHVSAEVWQIRVVNPLAYPAKGTDCPMFHPIKVIKMAWGMRQAIHRMSYEDGEKMKKWLNRYYPRMTLSRVMNHKRGIPPSEQNAIIRAFRSFGMKDENVFDKVTYTYEWSRR